MLPVSLITLNIFIFLWQFKITDDYFSFKEMFDLSCDPQADTFIYRNEKYIYNNPLEYLLNKKTYYKRTNGRWVLNLEKK